MRRVFSSLEISEAVLVRDALLHHGIEATAPGAQAGLSAIPEFRPPAEVWVVRDADFDAARRLVAETLATLDSKVTATPWVCASCGMDNPASFELCWSCGTEVSR